MDKGRYIQVPLLEDGNYDLSLPDRDRDQAETKSIKNTKHFKVPSKATIRNGCTVVIRIAAVTCLGLSIVIFASGFLFNYDHPSWSEATTDSSNLSISAPMKPHIPPSRTVYTSKKALISRKLIPHFEPQEILLQDMLRNMTKTESQLWEQVVLLHSWHYRGDPIGTRHPQAIVRANLTKLKEAPARQEPTPSTLEDPGELPYRGGNKEKYYTILGRLQSARDGDYTRAGKCPSNADWMAEHAALQMDMLSGKKPLKVTKFICAKDCGGVADRLLGMLSSLAFSVAHGRAWVTDWQDRQSPENAFDSPWIDWAYPTSADEESTHPLFSNSTSRNQAAIHNSIMFESTQLDEVWDNYDWETSLDSRDQSIHPLTSAAKSVWFNYYSNRGVARRFFRNPSARTKLNTLGLYQESIYTCLIEYLLRPRLEILEFTSPLSAYLSLPTVFSVGIQIRTGDKAMLQAHDSASSQKAIKPHSHFFECAAQVAKRFAQKDQKIVYFLMSDSQTLKEQAKHAYPDRLLTTNQRPRHIVYDNDLQSSMSVVAELEIMHATDIQIVSFCSGLGTLASLRSSNHGRTIAFPPSWNDKLGDSACPLKPHRRRQSNCMLDDVFVSTEELTSLWSLG